VQTLVRQLSAANPEFNDPDAAKVRELSDKALDELTRAIALRRPCKELRKLLRATPKRRNTASPPSRFSEFVSCGRSNPRAEVPDTFPEPALVAVITVSKLKNRLKLTRLAARSIARHYARPAGA
jgi:hypothetical protein